jgi:hypothetical protein
MNIDWNITTTQQRTSAAWRAAQHPEAITEAITMGEQVSDLLTHAARMVRSACQDVDTLVDHTPLRCQVILDRLAGETDRLTPMLRRLRAAAKAVTS